MEVQVANINNWAIESRTRDLSNLQMNAPSGTSTFNHVSFTATLEKDEAPIVLKVTPNPSANVGDLKFIMDPTIVNHTGFDMFDANISLVDGQTTPSTGPTHTPFAHFHDNSIPASFPNWEKPTTGSFDTLDASNTTTGSFQNINGANDLSLLAINSTGLKSGGTDALTGYGVHQFLNVAGPQGNGAEGSAGGNGGSFYVVISTGEPGNQGRFDQVLEGDDKDNVLTGDASHAGSPIALNDLILGYDGNDTLSGGLGNDTLVGENGDDILDGGAGTNILLGGNGTDTAVFDGTRASFTVKPGLFSDFTITKAGGGTIDEVTDVEKFKFSDLTVTKDELPAGFSLPFTTSSSPSGGGGMSATDPSQHMSGAMLWATDPAHTTSSPLPTCPC